MPLLAPVMTAVLPLSPRSMAWPECRFVRLQTLCEARGAKSVLNAEDILSLMGLSTRHGCVTAACAGSAPDFASGFHHQPELGKLLLFRQQVSVERRRKAALRRKAKLIQAHIFGRHVDPALQLVLVLKPTSLSGREREVCARAASGKTIE